MPAGGALSETKKALPRYGEAHYTSISGRIIVRMQAGAQGCERNPQPGRGRYYPWPIGLVSTPRIAGRDPVSCRTAMGCGGELRRGNE